MLRLYPIEFKMMKGVNIKSVVQIIVILGLTILTGYGLFGCATFRMSTPVCNIDWSNLSNDTSFPQVPTGSLYIQSSVTNMWVNQNAKK